MAFTKRDQEKLDALYVTLVGINGNPGFLSRFEELAKSHYRLKRLIYVGVALILGTGGVTALVLGVING